jgi:hypothetical protein
LRSYTNVLAKNMNSHDTSPTQYRHFWPALKYPQNRCYHTLFCIHFNCTSPHFDVSIYFTVALYIHQHHQSHQQLNPHTNILLCFASNIKPTKHSHLTLTMGFEMIFQGFQPSEDQIEDLEQGNPINDAERVRDAEQQRQQHLQQQQQDAVTRTLRYCTQQGSDEEHSGEENDEVIKEENFDEQKLSPHTQEQSHTSDGADSLSSTDANHPKTDAAEVPQEGSDHPDHPQDAATNSAAADIAPTVNEPNSAAEDPMEEEVDTNHTSDYSIYNLMASHILFPMPNNPTYQPIYQALQDYIPDTEQREQALQLLQEIAIVMFSEAGDLQSNVQSTDARVIFTPYQQANQQLMQTMASYIEESQKHIRPFVGGGGDGDGDDNGDDGWHWDSEDEADSDPNFKANLKKSLAEQKERHLLRKRHYKTWCCYTITLEFFISFLTIQRSKLRETELQKHVETTHDRLQERH